MLPPPPDPDVADLAPIDPALTVYGETHTMTYLRPPAAAAENADWREVALIVLHIDPDQEPTSQAPPLPIGMGPAYKVFFSAGQRSL